jgi:hypothetical protein
MRASFDGAGLTAGTSKAASPLPAPPSLLFYFILSVVKLPGVSRRLADFKLGYFPFARDNRL